MTENPKFSTFTIKGKDTSMKTRATFQTKLILTERSEREGKSSKLLLILLNKKYRARIEQSFLKIALQKNEKQASAIVAKYLSSILKFKIKNNTLCAWFQIKEASFRRKTLVSFLKNLNGMVSSKKNENLIYGFGKVRIYGLMNAQGGTTPEQKPPKFKEIKTFSASKRPAMLNRSLDRSVDVFAKSSSTSKLNVARRIDFQKQSDLPTEIEQIKRKNQELTLMQLSEEAREALKKVQRFDRFIYAQETEKICKEPLTAELKRLQRIKNSQKSMRVEYYDNELTITALYNHIKLISQMNRDIGDLKKSLQQFEKQSTRKKQEEFKAKMESRRNKQKSSGSKNSEEKIKQTIDKVNGHLHEGELSKAKADIEMFLKKYGKEQSAQDYIYIYQAFLQLLNESKESEKCFEEINKALKIISEADLGENDSQMRALKNNSRQLSSLRGKYSGSEKVYVKQMNSILQNLEKLNEDIIKCSQVKKQKEKQPQQIKPDDLVKLKKQHQEEINKLTRQYEQERKKQALLEVKLEKQSERKLQRTPSKMKQGRNYEEQIRKLQQQLKQKGKLESEVKRLQQELVKQKKSSEMQQKSMSKQKRVGKTEETIKLEAQIKQLEGQIQQMKQEKIQLKISKDKEGQAKSALNKATTNICVLIEKQNFRQVQTETSRIIKTYENDERFSEHIQVYKCLQMLIPSKNQLEESKRTEKLAKQLETQTEANLKWETIVKVIRSSESQIRSGKYLQDPNFWNNQPGFESVGQHPGLISFMRIFNLLKTEVQNRINEFNTLNQNYLQNRTQFQKSLQIVRKFDREMSKKDFFDSDDCWEKVTVKIEGKAELTENVLKLIHKYSEAWRTKIAEEKKENKQSIIRYESELSKLGSLIEQYEKRLEDKDIEYQQLYEELTSGQKQKVAPQLSSSLRSSRSRKSVKSNSSDLQSKQIEIQDLKTAIQSHAEQQKSMEGKIELLEDEKNYLFEKIKGLQRELESSYRDIEELITANKSLQNSLEQSRIKYGREREILQSYSKDHESQIDLIKRILESQYKAKQERFMNQISKLTEQRQRNLQKYHSELSIVQKELNEQINYLKQQLLTVKSRYISREDYTALSTKYSEVEFQLRKVRQQNSQGGSISQSNSKEMEKKYNELLSKSAGIQNENSRLLIEIKQAQSEVILLRQKLQIAKEAEKQILQKIQTNDLKNRQIQTFQSANSDRVSKLEEEIRLLNQKQQAMIDQQVKNALKFQEEDFNRFLDEHVREIEEHFEKVIIPSRIQEYQTKSIMSKASMNKADETLLLLKQYEVKIENQSRQLHEYEERFEQLNRQHNEIMAQVERKIEQLNEDSKKHQIRASNFEKSYQQSESKLNRQIKLTEQLERKIMGFESESTENRWENKIKEAIQQQKRTTLNFQNKIRSDFEAKTIPLQGIIDDLKIKYDEQVRLNKENQISFQKERNILESRLSSVNNQYNEQRNKNENLTNEMQRLKNQLAKAENRISELSVAHQQQISQLKLQGQISLEIRNGKSSNQVRIGRDLEEKREKQIMDSASLLREKTEKCEKLRSENQNLNREVSQLRYLVEEKQRQLKELEGRSLAQLREEVKKWESKLEQKTQYYEKRITEYTVQISSLQVNYHSSLTSFNHRECEEKYRILENRTSKEIYELRSKGNEIIKSEGQQVKKLRQIVESQKLQIKQLENKIKSIKEEKQEAYRQKQSYSNELKAVSSEREKQIYRIKSDFDALVSSLEKEKRNLESKLKENHQKSFQAMDSTGQMIMKQAGAQLQSKNYEIRQLEELLNRKNKQYDFEHRNLMKENQRLNEVIRALELHIRKLESDISELSEENSKCRENLAAMEGAQIAQERIKSQSNSFNNTSQLKEKFDLFENQAIIPRQPSFDSIKIKKLIRDIEAQKSGSSFGLEQSEVEVLKRINQEVSELVESNRHLQIKCALLEAQTHSNSSSVDVIGFFVVLQKKMEQLVDFLIESSLIESKTTYNKFVVSSKESLTSLNIEGYFRFWVNFMKKLFLNVNDLKNQQFKEKSEKVMSLKESMNSFSSRQMQEKGNGNDETLEKYKIIFADIRYLLQEYLKKADIQYLNMICKSLGFQEVSFIG